MKLHVSAYNGHRQVSIPIKGSLYILKFVKYSLVVTRWQQYSTHLHTKNIQNDTKQTIQQLRRVWVVPHLGKLYPGICLTT